MKTIIKRSVKQFFNKHNQTNSFYNQSVNSGHFIKLSSNLEEITPEMLDYALKELATF